MKARAAVPAAILAAICCCSNAYRSIPPLTRSTIPISRPGYSYRPGSATVGPLANNAGARPLQTLPGSRRGTALTAVNPLVALADAAQSVNWVAISHNTASILILAFIIFCHELGHYIGARSQGIKVKNFSIGFGPRLLSFKRNEIEYTIRAIPAGGFVSFPQHYEIDENGEVIHFEDKDLLQNRPPLQQAVVISAGVIANLFLSFGLLFGSVASTGLPRAQFSEGPLVVKLMERNAPAARADIRPQDIILAVNGQKVAGDESGLSRAVSLISETSGGNVELDLRREGKVIHKSIPPKRSPTGRSSIGVQMAAHVERVEMIRAKDPAEALKYSFEELNAMLKEATSSIQRFTKQGMEGLTGPLGIVQVGADLAAVDTSALIKFAAFISINLAVVNALPVPGLDGGQMVFVILEAIRGKRLSPKVEGMINAVAVLFLASLSFYLVTSDLSRGATPLEKLVEGNAAIGK